MCISDGYLYTLLTLYSLFLWTEGNSGLQTRDYYNGNNTYPTLLCVWGYLLDHWIQYLSILEEFEEVENRN